PVGYEARTRNPEPPTTTAMARGVQVKPAATTRAQEKYHGSVGGASMATASSVIARCLTAVTPPLRACHHCQVAKQASTSQATPRAPVTNGDCGTSTNKSATKCSSWPIPVGKFSQFLISCGPSRAPSQPKLIEPSDNQVPAA